MKSPWLTSHLPTDGIKQDKVVSTGFSPDQGLSVQSPHSPLALPPLIPPVACKSLGFVHRCHLTWVRRGVGLQVLAGFQGSWTSGSWKSHILCKDKNSLRVNRKLVSEECTGYETFYRPKGWLVGLPSYLLPKLQDEEGGEAKGKDGTLGPTLTGQRTGGLDFPII